jgi:hypothetical protein
MGRGRISGVARTLLNLAAVLPPWDLRRALGEADPNCIKFSTQQRENLMQFGWGWRV